MSLENTGISPEDLNEDDTPLFVLPEEYGGLLDRGSLDTSSRDLGPTLKVAEDTVVDGAVNEFATSYDARQRREIALRSAIDVSIGTDPTTDTVLSMAREFEAYLKGDVV